MKIKSLLELLCLFCLGACQQTEEVNPNQNVQILYEQFHGKYKIVHSTSSLALDVNLDGKASTDMLEELPDLPNTLIEVRINRRNQYNSQPSFYFVHYWPKQELDLHGFQVEPTNYDPNITAQFSTKVVSWGFAFDPALTHLILEPQSTSLIDPDIFTPPQKIVIEGNERMEVTLTKRLYTSSGWKIVEIVTVYERYTMIT
ncbi:hypothetical protein GXP67_07915 [Rhodocytophaga rosea]|uniref:Uncharacterized protein n=1 Tax=Rhodocytophaga rosea TaxID=2704465 RepID=A0A6C0GF43_9BACT|nr:hypothetical protein [Rhodocytophaga rosea]QHT66586.1 hypothetical protein GXP67_07915 [Rhodocytophaga rosea]